MDEPIAGAAGPITGEALLAAVGINAIIRPGKLRLTQEHRAMARKWDDGSLARKELKRFLTGEAEAEREPPEFDYQTVLEELSTPLDVEHVSEKISGDDPDESLALLMAASTAVDYLNGTLPKRTRQTISGPKPVDPSDIEVSKFRRAWAIMNRPALLFANCREGDLVSDEVKAFSVAFPGLYGSIKSALFGVLTDLVASKPNWEPSREKDRLLQILLQSRTLTPQLLQEMQAGFSGQDQTEQVQPSKKPLNAGSENMTTPTQRATFK